MSGQFTDGARIEAREPNKAPIALIDGTALVIGVGNVGDRLADRIESTLRAEDAGGGLDRRAARLEARELRDGDHDGVVEREPSADGGLDAGEADRVGANQYIKQNF